MAVARFLRPTAIGFSARQLSATRPSQCHSLLSNSIRNYATSGAPSQQPQTSPFAPRHFLSISDLTPAELTTLVRNALHSKTLVKSGQTPSHLASSLLGKTLALTFTKRSTRARVSSEAAVAMMGGHPMFLGSGDIQLGVNESLYDTSVVVSSMVAGIFARVNGHEDVAELAKHSSVPVVNALSDAWHPLQTVADLLTLVEAFPASSSASKSGGSLGLEGLKLAWIGDANNVLFDLAVGCAKQGIQVAVATPSGYTIPDSFRDVITSSSANSGFSLTETTDPAEAAKDADVLVTDTWVSMGQESDTAQRLKDFEGFQITSELAQKGGAKEGWKFMHCLPRHPEEVSDEVFYNSARSLVFPEAENRLWAAVSVLDAFVAQKGKIRDARDL